MRIRLNWLVFLLYCCAFLLSAPNAVIAADKQVYKDEAGEVLYTIDENGIVSMFENGPGTDITLSVTRGTREQMQPRIIEVTPNTVAAGTYTVLKLEGKNLVGARRSEEHTSELQSLRHLVCRLLLEKKKKYKTTRHMTT